MAFHSKYLISTAGADEFIRAGRAFCDWFETFDPKACSLAQVADALHALTELSNTGLGENPSERPRYRPFRPNEEWQRNRRKAARLPMDGYCSDMLPNDDGLAFTQCSLAYDLSDFYEFMAKAKPDRLAKYLGDRSWPYVQLRIQACANALRRCEESKLDPFVRINVRGRALRFVGWRSSGWTHASEDPETERRGTTLCGGERSLPSAYAPAMDLLLV